MSSEEGKRRTPSELGPPKGRRIGAWVPAYVYIEGDDFETEKDALDAAKWEFSGEEISFEVIPQGVRWVTEEP